MSITVAVFDRATDELPASVAVFEDEHALHAWVQRQGVVCVEILATREKP